MELDLQSPQDILGDSKPDNWSKDFAKCVMSQSFRDVEGSHSIVWEARANGTDSVDRTFGMYTVSFVAKIRTVTPTPCSHAKQSVDDRNGRVLVCCVMEGRPPVFGGGAVEPGFVVRFLDIFEDGEQSLPVAILRCVAEVRACLIVGAVCACLEVVDQPGLDAG